MKAWFVGPVEGVNLPGWQVTHVAHISRHSVDADCDLVLVAVTPEVLTPSENWTRYAKADMGERPVPVVWLTSANLAVAGYEAGADLVLVEWNITPVEPWLRARRAMRNLAAKADEVRAVNEQLQSHYATESQHLELARRVRGLVDGQPPDVPGWQVDVSAQERGAMRWIPMGNSRWGFRLVDVPAAPSIIAELVRLAVDTVLLPWSDEPSELLSRANRAIIALKLDPPMMVAGLIGILDIATNSITFARAGDCCPTLIAGDDVTILDTPGGYLGVYDDRFPSRIDTLEPGAVWEAFAVKITRS
jgi:Stage II sporulation protein E (SpoIIE)